MEIERTTPNSAPASPLSCMAAMRNTVATVPESRLTLTGVPSVREILPKKPPKNAPSAAVSACIRSLMIIHAAP
jgi:hypothetical protein